MAMNSSEFLKIFNSGLGSAHDACLKDCLKDGRLDDYKKYDDAHTMHEGETVKRRLIAIYGYFICIIPIGVLLLSALFYGSYIVDRTWHDAHLELKEWVTHGWSVLSGMIITHAVKLLPNSSVQSVETSLAIRGTSGNAAQE